MEVSEHQNSSIAGGKWNEYKGKNDTEFKGCYVVTSKTEEGYVKDDMYRITFGGRVVHSSEVYKEVNMPVDGKDFLVREIKEVVEPHVIGKGKIVDDKRLEMKYLQISPTN